MRFYQQPLLHFLLLGAIIFAGLQWIDDGERGELAINRESFLEFLQYRNNGISTDAAINLLNSLSATQRSALLNKHIEEEVLYHQALALALDKKDYVIKQRLIQKMEYLLEGADAEPSDPTHAELKDFYQRNIRDYMLPETVTFSHVYIAANQDSSQAKQRAQEILAVLNDKNVPFEGAVQYGDRFIYFANYVERDQSLIAAHFGDEFANWLFQQSPANGRWLNPIQSDHGWHIVNLSARREARTPALEAINARVLHDARRAHKEQARQRIVGAMVDDYGLDVQAILNSLD